MLDALLSWMGLLCAFVLLAGLVVVAHRSRP